MNNTSKKSSLNSQKSPTKLGHRRCKISKQGEPFPIVPDNIIGMGAVDPILPLGAVDPIQQIKVISAGTVDGNNNRPVTVKNVTSKIWKQKKRLQEKITELQNADADEFCYKLMLAVCQKSGEKIEVEQIPEDETLYWYTTNKGVIFDEFVGQKNSEMIAIILPWCWFDGLRTRTKWEDKKERDAKREMNKSTGSHAKSLRLLLNQNIKEKYRDQNLMADYYDNKFITYGDYEDRPSAFVIRFEVRDTSVIADYLVPGFINCNTYSYDTQDSKEVPQRIFWNGKKLCTTNLRYVKLVGAPDKYVIIDVAKKKEDKQLVIDSKGLRGERVAFYRVGDFLTLDEINCIIKTCDTFKHAIPTFVLICVKYRHHQLLKKNQQLQSQKKNITEIEKADKIVQVATEFMQAFREVLCENFFIFSVAEFVRLSWVTWSWFDGRYDRMFTESGKQKRKNARKRATNPAADKEEKAQVYEDIRQLDYTTILSITQQGADESIQRMFRCISHKFDSLQSYLKPLQKMTFEEYFEVMVEICRPSCGMYTTRALTIISIFVVSAILFDGKVPTDSIDISSFWQINEKKANLIRNCISGNYDGVGCDTHVIDFLRACAELKGVKGLSIEDFYRLGKKVPQDPGAYLNEIIGECRQSYNARNNNSDLRWPKWRILLEKVSLKRDEFKQIIDALLPGWDNKVE